MLPVSDMSYYGFQGGGAYRVEPDQSEILLKVRPFSKVWAGAEGVINVLSSRRHGGGKVEELMVFLRHQFSRVDCVQAGSSLKICRVAEGIADFYVMGDGLPQWQQCLASFSIAE